MCIIDRLYGDREGTKPPAGYIRGSTSFRGSAVVIYGDIVTASFATEFSAPADNYSIRDISDMLKTRAWKGN